MKHWTDSTDAEAVELYATFSDTEIRRRQDLVAQQIRMAHHEWAEHGRDMTDALHDLRRMEDALAAAMLARL